MLILARESFSSFIVKRIIRVFCLSTTYWIHYMVWKQRNAKIGEKCGMTKEGVIRKVRFLNNQYYDSIKYGILREELAD